jgi:hypothetical protein
MGTPVSIRDLARNEFLRVGEIDRTERIDVLFEQHGTERSLLTPTQVASREVRSRMDTWLASPWSCPTFAPRWHSSRISMSARSSDLPASAAD